MRFNPIVAVLGIAALLSSAGAEPQTASPSAAQVTRSQDPDQRPRPVDTRVMTDIQVSDAWIRWLPAGLPGGGYMTLLNHGSTSHTLVSITSKDYADVGIHITTLTNGVAGMRPVDSIELKPNSRINFETLGYHLMLMGPRRTPNPGDHVTCTLHFADGQTLSVPFEVRQGA